MSASFNFGLITDVQYADVEDASSFSGNELRSYRGALTQVTDATSYWKNTIPDAKFILQLGDLIDGQNSGDYGEGLKWKDAPNSMVAATQVLAALEQGPCNDIMHVIGNHELYNFSREELCGPPFNFVNAGRHRTYHSFQPVPGWRFVVLDTYDVSILGKDQDPEDKAFAVDLIKEHNHNPSAWGEGLGDYHAGITDVENLRFCAYNGGLGQQQMAWLEAELSAGREAREKVVVCGHVPIFWEASTKKEVLFNTHEVMEMLEKSAYTPTTGGVVAVFCGHLHSGGYAVSPSGIHHVTFEAPLSCPQAFCAISATEDRFVISSPEGSAITSRELLFPQ